MKKQYLVPIIVVIIVLALCAIITTHHSRPSHFGRMGVEKNSCEKSKALDGYDYFSKPTDKSMLELRVADWNEFSSFSGNISFKYPKDLRVNKENVDESGIGVYYITLPSTNEFIPLMRIDVVGELPTSEGWSSEEIFNNQNDIDKQLSRLASSTTVFDYEPCVAEPGQVSSRVLVRNTEGLNLFLKNSAPLYVHASLVLSPDGASWDKEWEEELVLILNSIHFKSL